MLTTTLMATSTVPVNNAHIGLATTNVDANGITLVWSAGISHPDSGSALASQQLIFWTDNNPNPKTVNLGPNQNSYTFTQVNSGAQYYIELEATFVDGSKLR